MAEALAVEGLAPAERLAIAVDHRDYAAAHAQRPLMCSREEILRTVMF